MPLNNETKILIFFTIRLYKMKTSPSERKKKKAKARRERITLFNKANHLGSNDASVYDSRL